MKHYIERLTLVFFPQPNLCFFLYILPYFSKILLLLKWVNTLLEKKKKHRLRINYQHVLSPGILNPPFPMLLSILLFGSFFCLLPPSLPFPEIFLYSFIYLILIFINLCWRKLSCNCDWKKKSLYLDHHLDMYSFCCALSIVILLKA